MEADFRIGDWIVRPQRDCLERGKAVVHIAPKAMGVLCCLARADGEVVARQVLFDSVWRDSIVTDDALTQRIVELRKAFGDSARQPSVIETIPKVGFRLIAPVSPLSPPGTGPHATHVGRSPPALGRPSALLAALLALGVSAGGIWLIREPAGWADRRPAIASRTGDASTASVSSAPGTPVGAIETATHPFEAYQALRSGHLALKRGGRQSLEQAIAYYRHAIDLDPDFPQAYLALARAYTIAVEELGVSESEARGKIDEYARAALELDPRLGMAYSYLAVVRREEGRLDEAENLFRRAIDLEPGNPQILHGMGLTLRLQGRAQEAIPYYDRAAQIDPLNPTITESRGSLLRDLGRFEEAERQYRDTIEIDPRYVAAHWGLGTLYWSTGRPEEALRWFENAVYRAPESDVFRALAALMCLEIEDDTRARAMIQAALQRTEADDENDAMLPEELLRLYHGEEYGTLPDGRRFMSRYWYGALVDLPLRSLLDGRFQTAISEYEARFPRLTRAAVSVDASNYRAAIYLAFAYSRDGDKGRVAELLDAVEAFLPTQRRLGIHGYWLTDVQLMVLRGNPASGMRWLEQAVDAGWRNLWRFYLLHDPIITMLSGESGYDELVDRVSEDMRVRRSAVQASLGRPSS
ncbi:MAG: tetratricopeptide repeat protein [Gammaproteobacteria bacterium]